MSSSRPQLAAVRAQADNGSVPIQPRHRMRSPSAAAIAAQLSTVQRDYAELYSELFSAAQVQRRLTGPRQFRRGAYEIACEIFAVRQISGDFFCAFDVGEVTIFAFGDVAGKGLAAGMWVNHIASLVRKYGKLFPHPARIATLINDDLADIPSGAPITTMFIAVLDPALHRVTYCNAGHPAPLLVRSDDVERLEVGGPVLGAVSTANYESSAIGLAARDMIVCYSDGLSEARGTNGEEFGMERLISEAQCATRQPLSSSLFSIFGAVQDFAGATRRDDDMSLAILRRTDIPR